MRHPTAVLQDTDLREAWYWPLTDDQGKQIDAVLLEYPKVEIIQQTNDSTQNPATHYQGEAKTNADLGARTAIVQGQTAYVIPPATDSTGTRLPGGVEFTLNTTNITVRGYYPTNALLDIARSLTPTNATN